MKIVPKIKPFLSGAAVFLVVLCLSVSTAFFIYRQNVEATRVEFEARADSLAAQITRELANTVAIIRSSAAALQLNGDTEDDVLRELLYAYLERGDVLTNSPSIRNIGLVMNRAFGQSEPQAAAFPLVGVYPDTTSRVIGTDLSFSPERVAAINYARDTGNAGVGDRIVLLSGMPGVFFAYPIYTNGANSIDADVRFEQTIGMVVAVLATDRFMASALNEIDLRDVDFEVHDLGTDADLSVDPGPQTVLASSRLDHMAYTDLTMRELLVSAAPNAIIRDLSIGGHTWRLLLAPSLTAEQPFGSQVALLVGIVGLILSALSGFATHQQLSQAALLKQRVDERTFALRTANSQITKQANEDALTGLGNRRALSDAIKGMIEREPPHPSQSIAAVHIDLDRFKQINDTMGHAGGDFILRHVASLMQSSFPKGAFCARVGGDEFTAAMIIDTEQEEHLLAAADRLVEDCARPVEFSGRLCRFGASAGIAVQALDSVDPASLLINADLALYRAKGAGKGCVRLFSPEIHAEVVAHKDRADDILRAIEAGHEFIPFFQPQVRYSTGELYGVEALARWKHPKLGILPPNEFLPIAEELGVVAQIDRLILESAIAVLNRANDEGNFVPHLSTNLSFSRLMEDDFCDSIANLPKCSSPISFEILESIFLDDDSDPAIWNIDTIKNAGMEVQIDDFGSGRASVLALTRIAPNRMKIDRELVAPIADHEERLRLVQSIVEIGKVLGIGVTAEGVETHEQARLLGDMGCDVLQGYLFSPPLSEAGLLEYLQKGSFVAASGQ